MNREGRAASWSALVHGAAVLLLVLFWKGEPLRDKSMVTIDFSLEQPVSAPPQPEAPKEKPVRQPVARPVSQPAPQPVPRPVPQPVQAVKQQPVAPAGPVHPAAENAAEAVLPYSPPRPQAPVKVPEPAANIPVEPAAVPAPAPAVKREEQKKRYLREHFIYIRDSIMQKVSYPPMARKMGWQGTVTLRFVVEEDGRVSQVRVEKSSGFPLLDRSAAESVKSAAPFPKPPVAAEIVMPINYMLE